MSWDVNASSLITIKDNANLQATRHKLLLLQLKYNNNFSWIITNSGLNEFNLCFYLPPSSEELCQNLTKFCLLNSFVILNIIIAWKPWIKFSLFSTKKKSNFSLCFNEKNFFQITNYTQEEQTLANSWRKSI